MIILLGLGWVQDGQAFLFTLINPSNKPEKRPIITNNPYVIHLATGYGPSAVYGSCDDFK